MVLSGTTGVYTVAMIALAACGACSPTADVGNYPGDSGPDTSGDADSDTDSDGDTDTDWPPSQTTPETCAEAETMLTSMGCEFYAADLDLWGGQDWCDMDDTDDSIFALVIANPQEESAAVYSVFTVVGGNEACIHFGTIAPGGAEVVHATGDCADCLLEDRAIQTQGIGAGLAFRIESDVPVMAFQWNPYDDANEGEASLLLPAPVLQADYLAQTWRVGDDCGSGDGFFDNASEITVIATEDGTTLTVTPKRDDIPAAGGIGPVDVGTESPPYELDALDVVSFAAATDGTLVVGDNDANAGDLTGTVISANAPIAVFGGHVAGIVASASSSTIIGVSSNHIEEQLLPISAWGTSAVLARHAVRPLLDDDEDPVLWRVVAGAAGMTVAFDPPLPVPWGASRHFSQRGEVFEFVSHVSHVATGMLDEPLGDEDGAPFLAYQLMSSPVGPSAQGDGMMLLAAPTEQYLDRYVFVTSTEANYDYDYIIVVKRSSAIVRVDCMGVIDEAEFEPIGSSAWEIAWIYLDSPTSASLCTDGPQLVRATDRVGVSVVGTGEYGAYGFLAGTGVAVINPIIE